MTSTYTAKNPQRFGENPTVYRIVHDGVEMDSWVSGRAAFCIVRPPEAKSETGNIKLNGGVQNEQHSFEAAEKEHGNRDDRHDLPHYATLDV